MRFTDDAEAFTFTQYSFHYNSLPVSNGDSRMQDQEAP